MNTRIEQLTRNYLDSLHLSSWELNDDQKRDIIRLNKQSEWIIFRTNSIKRNDPVANGFYTVTNTPYTIESQPLQELFEEQIKIYHCEDWKDAFIEDADSIKIEDVKVTRFFWEGEDDGKRVNNHSWIAVNKTATGNKIGETFMTIDEADLTMGVGHRKVKYNLNDLLNDPTIKNSTAPSINNTAEGNQGQGTPPPNQSHPQSSQPTPPHTQPTSIKDLTFTIDNVIEGWGENSHFNFITLATPIVVENTDIHYISIHSNDPLLKAGNQVTIRDVSFGPGQAEVDNFAHDISIKNFFHTIELAIGTTPPPTTSTPPTLYPEVQNHNQDLASEENRMASLEAELREIITIKNEKVRQDGQALGLNLPAIPISVLDYFQGKFFQPLDETKLLVSHTNIQISVNNGIIKQKKLNIEDNVRRIYKSNVKKITDSHQNGPSSPQTDNSLTQSKNQAINRINEFLADPNNLRNIDLNTLNNGRYQNWENNIEQITTNDELEAFVEDFLTVLKERGAKEKEQEEINKNNSNNLPNSKEDNIITDDIEKAISNLPLTKAKNIAKNKIRQLLNKHAPNLDKIKKVWTGEENWMTYLEKCNNSEEVATFLKRLEKEIIQQALNKEENKENDKIKNSWHSLLLPIIIISLLALTSLAIIIKLRYKRKKTK